MIYLDHAASSFPKAPGVIDAVGAYLSLPAGSPGRAGYGTTVEASRVIFAARESVAALFGVRDSRRIIFTSGATESLNIVINGLLRPGDVVVTTRMEHNSVVRPLVRLSRERGVKVRVLTSDPAPEEFSGARLAVVCHGSNVTGELAPVERITDLAHRAGALVLLDAAQTAGTLPLNLPELGVDAMACSGHKGLLGPQGTGVLYLREGMQLPEPLKVGGTGSRSESELQPEFLPDRYESGTANGPGIAGLGAAVEFLRRYGVERIADHIVSLGERFPEGESSIAAVRLFGPKAARDRLGTFSLVIPGRDNARVALQLEQRYGIAVRAGLHCAPWAHRAIGTFPQGTIRVSLGHSTTAAEVDTVIAAFREIAS